MAPPSVKLKVLAALPGTCAQLAAKSNTSLSSARDWMKDLRGTEAHIGGWELAGKNYTPVWHAGPGDDAKCPFKAGNASYWSKLYRQRIKKSGEYDFHLARRRAKYHAKKLIEKIKKEPKQSWAAALGL